MGMALWLKLKSDPKGFLPDDLYWLNEQHQALDALCRARGLAPLEDFIDYGDAAWNTDMVKTRSKPTWIAPEKLLPSLTGLKDACDTLPAEIDKAGLMEELDYVIGRCNEAVTQGVKVRFLLVM